MPNSGRKKRRHQAASQSKKRLHREAQRCLPQLEPLENSLLPSLTPYLVANINPGPPSSGPAFLANMNGTLFFNVDDGIHGHELWESNGTSTGTHIVADINPGPASSGSSDLVNMDGTLFFTAYVSTAGRFGDQMAHLPVRRCSTLSTPAKATLILAT
jgi:ELWxxDGT repeat protein